MLEPLPRRQRLATTDQPRDRAETEFYRIEHFPLPKEINLMVTGMDWISNDELAVCTWAGEIYIVETTGPVESARYRRFARGLNEPLGEGCRPPNLRRAKAGADSHFRYRREWRGRPV